MPDTAAPSAGEDKAGAESVEELGIGVGVGVVSSPNRPQANPDTSNIPKSNTMVILELFTFYLQLFREISSRMLYNNTLLCGHLFINVFYSSSTLVTH